MLPDRISPNHLTVFGVLGAVLVLFSGIMANEHVGWLWIFNLGLLIHWAGDSLDGTVARIRGIERPRFGFFIDQMTDIVTNILIVGGVIATGHVRVDVMLCVLISYQMLGMFSLISSISNGRFLVTIGGLGPTEVRAGIVLINTLIYFFGAATWTILGINFTWCDLMFASGTGIMVAFFFHGFITEGHRLSNEDPSS
jgi:archaetidylinositol phosphate synthase